MSAWSNTAPHPQYPVSNRETMCVLEHFAHAILTVIKSPPQSKHACTLRRRCHTGRFRLNLITQEGFNDGFNLIILPDRPGSIGRCDKHALRWNALKTCRLGATCSMTSGNSHIERFWSMTLRNYPLHPHSMYIKSLKGAWRIINAIGKLLEIPHGYRPLNRPGHCSAT